MSLKAGSITCGLRSPFPTSSLGSDCWDSILGFSSGLCLPHPSPRGRHPWDQRDIPLSASTLPSSCKPWARATSEFPAASPKPTSRAHVGHCSSPSFHRLQGYSRELTPGPGQRLRAALWGLGGAWTHEFPVYDDISEGLESTL